jgi:peptidoglycan/xylan/chitin deacetylase (PgdA/CDA1 family)
MSIQKLLFILFIIFICFDSAKASCIPQKTIELKSKDYPLIGTGQYKQTLPLKEKEIVLTFDDGPNINTTESVLNTLNRFCLKATFFVVGRMVDANPSIFKKVIANGHNIGNHSYNHPMPFNKLKFVDQYVEIENGNYAIHKAGGDISTKLFRFPGLGRTTEAEHHLNSRDISVWSVDIETKDYMFSRLNPNDATKKMIDIMNVSLKQTNKGILLMHDIHRNSATALPYIIEYLYNNGYTFVHIKM